jgi:hypothetical protein
MVRPNFRDIRVSMAHLLPSPPPSQAPKRTFSIRALVASWLFWLRLVCVALVALALYPMTVGVAQDQNGPQHFRLVLDLSASMAVEHSGGALRMDAARILAQQAFAKMSALQSETPETCVDVAFVTGGVTVVPAARAERLLEVAEASAEGASVATLLSAVSLAAPNACDSIPTHAVVVSDQPPQPVPPDRFAGAVIWQQVGIPRDNRAIWSARVNSGYLRDASRSIDLRVASFGTVPPAVSATVEGPSGTSLVAMRLDETRAGGWRADIPFEGAGTYRVTLADGGALSVDDTIVLELGPIDRIAVDWQVPDLPRPQALLQVGEGSTTITVAQYAGGNVPLPEGPFVLVYEGWPTPRQNTIGPFMRDHPILEGINLDVFERVVPRTVEGLEIDGLASVIRPNGQAGIWIGVRDVPRGAIVPRAAGAANDDVRGLSKLMFYNALSWVAQSANSVAPPPIYVTKDAQSVPNALAESNTARALSDPVTLALLEEPFIPGTRADPEGALAQQDSPLTPWLIAMVLAVLLIERGIGLIWKRQRDA